MQPLQPLKYFVDAGLAKTWTVMLMSKLDRRRLSIKELIYMLSAMPLSITEREMWSLHLA